MKTLKFDKKISKQLLDHLEKQIKAKKNPSCGTAYMYYLKNILKISPVVYMPSKTIYESIQHCIEHLSDKNEIYRETSIKICYQASAVNNETTKIYICPYSGKIFGNNTHENPQDAIYDWVSRCPENKDYINGIKSKKFFISEDPKTISQYINKNEKTIEKKVYAPFHNKGILKDKVYNTISSLEKDIANKCFKSISIQDCDDESRYIISDGLTNNYLNDDTFTEFYNILSNREEFDYFTHLWSQEEEEEHE